MTTRENLKRHLNDLMEETGNLNDFRITIDTIFRVVKNIYRHPGNESYRRLSYTLNDDLHLMWQFEAVRMFLYDMGWTHDEDFLFCQTLKNMEVALEVLRDFRYAMNFDNEREGVENYRRAPDKLTCTTKEYQIDNEKHRTAEEELIKIQQYWIEKTYFIPVSTNDDELKSQTKSHHIDRLILSEHPIVVPIPVLASPNVPVNGANLTVPAIQSKDIVPSFAKNKFSSPSKKLRCSPTLSSPGSLMFEEPCHDLSPKASKRNPSTAVTIVTGLCNTAVNTVTRLEQCFKKISLIPVNPLSSNVKSGAPSAKGLMSDLCSSAIVNMVSELDKSAESIMSVSQVYRVPLNENTAKETTTIKTLTTASVNIMSDLYTAALKILSGLQRSTKIIYRKIALAPV